MIHRLIDIQVDRDTAVIFFVLALKITSSLLWMMIVLVASYSYHLIDSGPGFQILIPHTLKLNKLLKTASGGLKMVQTSNIYRIFVIHF